ncbi:MAG: hypothetical protein SGBAC_001101 [Bacillariaceae sp.]
MKLFQIVVLVSCFEAIDAQLHSASLESFASFKQGAHYHITESDASSHLLLPPSSPDCWLETLQELYPNDFGGSGQQQPLDLSTCFQLDTHHQQALALRLTKCHLETMGRPLVTTTEDTRNACDDLHHPSGIKDCLLSLSETAGTTYTLFFKDLHYVCTRLLQESVTNRYYQTTQDLEQVSKLAEARLQNILHQQEESSIFWKQKEERMAEWFHEQSQSSANQVLELQEQMQSKQQEDLHRHKEELQSLADVLQTTKASIQPWTQLVDFVFRCIPIGFSVLKIAASMLRTMVIIMILTPHKQLRRTRLKLLVVLLLGGLGEIVLLWSESEDEMGLTAVERLELSEGLRSFVVFFLSGVYLSGLVSFCCGCKRQHKEEDENEFEEDLFRHPTALLHRENELLKRLRLYSYQQQQHWRATVAQEQLQQQREQRHNVEVRSPAPFFTTSSPPPPPLIYSPESGSMTSAPSIIAAPSNVPPSPWTPHRPIPIPIPVYPDTTASNGNVNMHATTTTNNHEFVIPAIQETIDLPPDERDDEEESDETRDDTDVTKRKRTSLEMAASIDQDWGSERDLPVAKKPRLNNPKLY